MVIGRPNKNGISAIVILGDDEFLPGKFDDQRVIVFRQGNSTGRQLKMIKPLGERADPALLRPEVKLTCTFQGGADPLHMHDDKTWWFYDENWSMEMGPYVDYNEAYNGLAEYCVALQAAKDAAVAEALTEDENRAKTEAENKEPKGGQDEKS